MKILIVAATWLEVKLLVDEFDPIDESSQFLKRYRFEEIEIDVLVTGIGVTFTTFHLTRTLTTGKYNLVVNTGIAGSLTKEIEIGDVVEVIADEFGDLGIEKEGEFLTLFDAGFIDPSEFPFKKGVLKPLGTNGYVNLKKVRGITTNKSHGRKSTISELKSKFSAEVESMEGAAVFFVCNWLEVECCQIRAISNYVEPRENSLWNIPLALQKLREAMIMLMRQVPVGIS